MGVFEYSHEEGTVAGTMENDPKLPFRPNQKRRREELMACSRRCLRAGRVPRRAVREKKPMTTGVRLDVLIDGATSSAGRATTGRSAKAAPSTAAAPTSRPPDRAMTFVQSTRNSAPANSSPAPSSPATATT